MEIKLEIKKRNRDFGIVTWPYEMDSEVKSFFGLKDFIELDVDGKRLKNHRLSYKYRRFSIGKKRIAILGSKKKYFVITKAKDCYAVSFK